MVLSGKAYQIIKWVLCIVVDAFILLLTTLQKAWGWDIPIEAIVITITAVSTFFGVILGISNHNYYSQQEGGEEQ